MIPYGDKKRKTKDRAKEDISSLKITSTREISSNKLSKYTAYTIQNDELEFTINRRYNDFKWLRNLLLVCYPGLFVPPLPPPVFLGRFDSDFISKRRAALELFLRRIRKIEPFTKHEAYSSFMQCDDNEFLQRKSEIDANPSTTNPATANLALQTIYPSLKEYTPDTELAKFTKLHKHLLNIHEQMKCVDILGSKLYNHFNDISNEMPQFLNALNTLFEASII